MQKIKEFLSKYSWLTHISLAMWGLFITSWTTGIGVPLASIGLPGTLDARAMITALQATVHIPTWLVAVANLFVTCSVAYINHQTDTAKMLEGQKALMRVNMKVRANENSSSPKE